MVGDFSVASCPQSPVLLLLPAHFVGFLHVRALIFKAILAHWCCKVMIFNTISLHKEMLLEGIKKKTKRDQKSRSLEASILAKDSRVQVHRVEITGEQVGQIQVEQNH